MIEEKSIGEFIKELKKDASEYIELRLEHSKLVAYEKVAKLSASGLTAIVLGLIGFFGFFFLSFAGGYLLGELTGSIALGFGIISALYILLFVIILLIKKKYIEKVIVEKVIGILIEEHDQSDESNQ